MPFAWPPLLTWPALLAWSLAGAMLALFAMLLAAPLTLRGEGSLDGERLWGELRASWAFGLLSATLSPERRALSVCGWTFPIQRGASARPKTTKTEQRPRSLTSPRQRQRQRERIRRGSGRARLQQLIEQRETLLALLRRLSATVHWHLSVEGHAGLDDPGSTALSQATLEAVAAVLPRNVALAVRPDYLGGHLQLRARLLVKLWLGEVLLTFVGLLTRRDVWRAIAVLRR